MDGRGDEEDALDRVRGEGVGGGGGGGGGHWEQLGMVRYRLPGI